MKFGNSGAAGCICVADWVVFPVDFSIVDWPLEFGGGRIYCEWLLFFGMKEGGGYGRVYGSQEKSRLDEKSIKSGSIKGSGISPTFLLI